MEKQLPIVAFLYDFDKALCTTDMQDYAFIPSLGMTPTEFWALANGFGRQHRIDGILAYMYTMLRESERKNLPFTRQDLVEKGRGIVLFPGVQDWFRRINEFGRSQGVQVEHYKTALPAPAKPKAKPTLTVQKSPDELELKSVRTVYVVFAAIASMQGLCIDAITLRSKTSGRTYDKNELTPKKKGEIG